MTEERKTRNTRDERPSRTCKKDHSVLLTKKGPNFFREALFAGQHEEPEVDVSEFRIKNQFDSILG